MQKLIWILAVQVVLFSTLLGKSKMSQDLMQEIERTVETRGYIDVVVQLQKPVLIESSKFPSYGWTNRKKSSNLSPEDNSAAEAILELIRSKSRKEILFSDGPDINGKIYLKTIPAVVFEMKQNSAVLSLDVARDVFKLTSNAQNPAEIPYHLQPISWQTEVFQGSSGPTGSAYLAFRGKVEVKPVS